MIKYYKLFDLLNRNGMKKTDLLEIISSKTLAKISKGEYISGEVIEKICRFMNCQPGDIMEYITEEPIKEKEFNIYVTNEIMEINEKDKIEVKKNKCPRR